MIIGINVYIVYIIYLGSLIMIEAVNSILSNASVTRVVAEQQSTARSYAANPDKIQEAAKAPYLSQHIALDSRYNKAILQVRDTNTGDVLRQFPTEGQLKAYRTAQQFSDRRAAEATKNAVPTQSSSNKSQLSDSVSTNVGVSASQSTPAPQATSTPQSVSTETGVTVKTEA